MSGLMCGGIRSTAEQRPRRKLGRMGGGLLAASPHGLLVLARKAEREVRFVGGKNPSICCSIELDNQQFFGCMELRLSIALTEKNGDLR